MSLRLRLALWYGGLTGVVVLLVCGMTYALHTRAHYDDLDFTIASDTTHAAQEYASGVTTAASTSTLSIPTNFGIVVRVYDRGGRIVAVSPNAGIAPSFDPQAIATHPSVAPYGPIVALAPLLAAGDAGEARSGVFGLVTVANGNRWRVFVLPETSGTHYFTAIAPLDWLDAAIARFRELIILAAIVGALATFAAGWLLAQRALRPVAALTATASEIARSQELSKRVSVKASSRDELVQLAATFNQMLESVENAYHVQQRFVADASHELRAPLTAIQGNLELLTRVPDMPPAERQEALNEATREARRLSQLVADLLALARADAGMPLRRGRVELDRVMLEALAEARHLAQGQRLAVTELEPVLIEGDADRLEQLALILLDNAIKYTPADGEITLSLRKLNQVAELRVHDSGIGIASEDLPHIFERFYRAIPGRNRDPGGTGLGLAIAKWICQQHGGTLTVESVAGEGTTFTVRLPLRPAA